MTGSTILVGSGLNVSYVGRLVNQMTGYTKSIGLSGTMWFVAFHTIWNIPVRIMMTLCTVKFPVSTWVVFNLADLVSMAGVADCNIVFTKYDSKGLVWVCVTTEAVVHLVMRLSLVAHGALRNHFLNRSAGWMSLVVAVNAADF